MDRWHEMDAPIGKRILEHNLTSIINTGQFVLIQSDSTLIPIPKLKAFRGSRALGEWPNPSFTSVKSCFHHLHFGCGPFPVTVANKGLQGFPTKNGIILVVTVTGKGPYPTYTPVN